MGEFQPPEYDDPRDDDGRMVKWRVDTKLARDFAQAGYTYTGEEVRLWVHNMADEIDRLRRQPAPALAVPEPAKDEALNHCVGVDQVSHARRQLLSARRRRGIRLLPLRTRLCAECARSGHGNQG